MKKFAPLDSTGLTANLALALVVVGWLMITWGALSQLGDPSPTTPHEQLQAARDISLAFMFAGVIALATCAWLSGLAFRAARLRSNLAMVLVVFPLLGLFASALGARL